MKNREERKVSVLIGYALGKAQRLIKGVEDVDGKIFTHGAIENVNAILRKQGLNIPETTLVRPEIPKNEYQGQLVVAPPSALGALWMRRFQPHSTAMVSGWMALRGTRRRRAVDRGFVLSDHAGWEGLNQAIKSTGAENVVVTHGYTEIFAQWLHDRGYNAKIARTQFEGETLTGEDA